MFKINASKVLGRNTESKPTMKKTQTAPIGVWRGVGTTDAKTEAALFQLAEQNNWQRRGIGLSTIPKEVLQNRGAVKQSFKSAAVNPVKAEAATLDLERKATNAVEQAIASQVAKQNAELPKSWDSINNLGQVNDVDLIPIEGGASQPATTPEMLAEIEQKEANQRIILIVLAVVVVAVAGYFMFFKKKKKK